MDRNIKDLREELYHQRETLKEMRRNRKKEMEEVVMGSKHSAQLWEDEAHSLRKEWNREREVRLKLQKLMWTIRHDIKF